MSILTSKEVTKPLDLKIMDLLEYFVDGLVYVSISDIPERTFRHVMEEFHAELKRNYGTKKKR